MLDRIHKTAKAVYEKTGATISIQVHTGDRNSLNMQVYPAGWHEARKRAENGTASLDEWNLSRSVEHYENMPSGSEGQAEALEILEAMLWS